MPTTRVEIALQFAAAHRATSPKSGCEGLHGHTFRLTVALEGVPESESGTFIDLPYVRSVLHEIVYRPFDHDLLNNHLENPTLERLAEFIHAQVAAKLVGVVETALEDGIGRTVRFRP